ncbi:hypothetical protein [Flavobacteriaceae bacterium 14752]|uniref:hypothetical protein n=1 Tax=Mesohalobacter salilacus TaxID=2491711 RepID=UPI000F62FF91|nr:hypothetical protein EIG84_08915 [Flavobacteriaceae bacterium 14752]
MKTNLFTYTILIISIFSNSVLSQGLTVKSENGEPIPFTNVIILKDSLVYFANEKGEIKLPQNIRIQDSILFNHISYQNVVYTLGYLKSTPNIVLKPRLSQLDDVNISSAKKENEIALGATSNHRRIDFILNPNKNLTELARFIKNDRSIEIQEVEFKIDENQYDIIVFKLNFYNVNKNNLPGDKIYGDNLYYELKRKDRKVKIKLENENIILDEDFFISIEIVDIKGEGELILNGEWKYYTKGHFFRTQKINDWKVNTGNNAFPWAVEIQAKF